MEGILQKIIDSRKTLMKSLGLNFGVAIPKARERAVHPFPSGRGAIMEIKRASPSKGNIKADLDVEKQARSYIDAGAVGISVLTETQFFKGSLSDLIKVASLAGRTPLLRKDFLLDSAEVEVSYLCGADAILIIARILDKAAIDTMVARCKAFGMTAFIELHCDEDVQKVKDITYERVVYGVNTRNLDTFECDPLTAAAFKADIFESGVFCAEDAAFANALGYKAVLVGESVIRDVTLAKSISDAMKAESQKRVGDFWKKVAKASKAHKPMIKLCGVTSARDGVLCAKAGADFIGFVMSKKTVRGASVEVVREAVAAIKKEFFDKVSEEGTVKSESYSKVDERGKGGAVVAIKGECFGKAGECGKEGVVSAIKDECFDKAGGRNEGGVIKSEHPNLPLFIGVITEQNAEALSLVREGVLDALQFHDCPMPSFCDPEFFDVPRYACVKSVTDKAPGFPRALCESISHEGVWVAGGVTQENVGILCDKELIDLARGSEESAGVKSEEKIKRIMKIARGAGAGAEE